MSINAKSRSLPSRLFYISLLFALLAVILLLRFFDLQILHFNYYRSEAEARQVKATLPVERGLIYLKDEDGTLVPIALNKKFYNVYVVPKEIENPEEVINQLSAILKIDKEKIKEHVLKPNDPYEPIANKIEDENLIKQINSLNLKGVYTNYDFYRYYPFKNLASQVIGFVAPGEDNKLIGRYGLEKYYNNLLMGRPGSFLGFKDAAGRLIRSLFYSEKSSLNGSSLVLTLDKNIQFKAESEAKNLGEAREAEAASIIVLDPKTGKILALANWPNFDLNNYSSVHDLDIFRNRTVENRYEYGSVFKPLTMAMGIELGVLGPDTTYVDTGVVKISGHEIRNFRNEVYGQATMTKVLEQSINTGAVYAESLIGNENFLNFLKTFGVDNKTGVDLPDEVSGDISNLEGKNVPAINFATASFGQGISFNFLNLVRLYAILANKGKNVYPYIVEEIRSPDGDVSKTNLAEPAQIISPQTAETVTDMLVHVVENGYGKNAAINGYTIAGKTGTAQIPLPNGTYSKDDTLQSFVGFFPAHNPLFVIGVDLYRPKKGAVASETVTYVFRNLAFYLINYYNLPPDNP